MLPGCLPVAGPVASGPPLEIGFGAVPAVPGDARVAGPTIRVAGGNVWFHVAGMAACCVRDGQVITIEVEPGREGDDVLAALLAPLIALALHARGFLPLHASAVEVNDGAVAFVGRSCAGKSAIAAVLRARGRRLVCDDLCAVDTHTEGRPMLWPGPPSLRLWPDVLDALAIDHERTRPFRASLDKRVLEVSGVNGPLPIHHVTVIDARDAGGGIDRRSGFDALSVLVASSWHATALEAMQIRAAHFARCAHVARSAAIWHWSRPDGVQRMAGSLAGLEAAWRVASERRS